MDVNGYPFFFFIALSASDGSIFSDLVRLSATLSADEEDPHSAIVVFDPLFSP